ncbi:hypothetical protein WA026_021641, partial [Henosepilachna vigintioctopunctata]
MFFVILLLVSTTVSSGGYASPSAHNDISHKESYIKNVGTGLKFREKITLESGGFQVVSFLATFLKLIGNNALTISVKQGGFTPTNKRQKITQPQFHTSLPLIQLGNAGKYYYFETSLRLNYFEAFAYCRRNHMDLLSIESKEEDDLIKHYMFKEFPRLDSIWTSGTDIGRKGIMYGYLLVNNLRSQTGIRFMLWNRIISITRSTVSICTNISTHRIVFTGTTFLANLLTILSAKLNLFYIRRNFL